jgi:hypothetical protein
MEAMVAMEAGPATGGGEGKPSESEDYEEAEIAVVIALAYRMNHRPTASTSMQLHRRPSTRIDAGGHRNPLKTCY